MRKASVEIAKLCVCVSAMLLLPVGVFYVSNRVDATRTEITALNQQVKMDLESLQVLRAEWSYLTRPERIRQLVAGNTPKQELRTTAPQKQVVAPMQLAAIVSEQYRELADLPMQGEGVKTAQPVMLAGVKRNDDIGTLLDQIQMAEEASREETSREDLSENVLAQGSIAMLMEEAAKAAVEEASGAAKHAVYREEKSGNAQELGL